jgi:hypothetical protein
VAGAGGAGQSGDQEAEGHQVEVRGHRNGEGGTRRRVRKRFDLERGPASVI